MRIRVNSIDYRGSIVDGPGVRTVVFLQGCNRRCEGCHNPDTWNIEGGQEMDVDCLVQLLKMNSKSNRITISGGEPLIQRDAVVELVSRLRGFDVALYTSYDFEAVPKQLLGCLSHLKVGRFKKEQSCTTESYIGSRNQKFISLKGSA